MATVIDNENEKETQTQGSSQPMQISSRPATVQPEQFAQQRPQGFTPPPKQPQTQPVTQQRDHSFTPPPKLSNIKKPKYGDPFTQLANQRSQQRLTSGSATNQQPIQQQPQGFTPAPKPPQDDPLDTHRRTTRFNRSMSLRDKDVDQNIPTTKGYDMGPIKRPIAELSNRRSELDRRRRIEDAYNARIEAGYLDTPRPEHMRLRTPSAPKPSNFDRLLRGIRNRFED